MIQEFSNNTYKHLRSFWGYLYNVFRIFISSILRIISSFYLGWLATFLFIYLILFTVGNLQSIDEPRITKNDEIEFLEKRISNFVIFIGACLTIGSILLSNLPIKNKYSIRTLLYKTTYIQFISFLLASLCIFTISFYIPFNKYLDISQRKIILFLPFFILIIVIWLIYFLNSIRNIINESWIREQIIKGSLEDLSRSIKAKNQRVAANDIFDAFYYITPEVVKLATNDLGYNEFNQLNENIKDIYLISTGSNTHNGLLVVDKVHDLIEVLIQKTSTNEINKFNRGKVSRLIMAVQHQLVHPNNLDEFRFNRLFVLSADYFKANLESRDISISDAEVMILRVFEWVSAHSHEPGMLQPILNGSVRTLNRIFLYLTRNSYPLFLKYFVNQIDTRGHLEYNYKYFNEFDNPNEYLEHFGSTDIGFSVSKFLLDCKFTYFSWILQLFRNNRISEEWLEQNFLIFTFPNINTDTIISKLILQNRFSRTGYEWDEWYAEERQDMQAFFVMDYKEWLSNGLFFILVWRGLDLNYLQDYIQGLNKQHQQNFIYTYESFKQFRIIEIPKFTPLLNMLGLNEETVQSRLQILNEQFEDIIDSFESKKIEDIAAAPVDWTKYELWKNKLQDRYITTSLFLNLGKVVESNAILKNLIPIDSFPVVRINHRGIRDYFEFRPDNMLESDLSDGGADASRILDGSLYRSIIANLDITTIRPQDVEQVISANNFEYVCFDNNLKSEVEIYRHIQYIEPFSLNGNILVRAKIFNKYLIHNYGLTGSRKILLLNLDAFIIQQDKSDICTVLLRQPTDEEVAMMKTKEEIPGNFKKAPGEKDIDNYHKSTVIAEFHNHFKFYLDTSKIIVLQIEE